MVNMEEVADLNSLYIAAVQSCRGVSWKASVQRYRMDLLSNIVRARRDLLSGKDMHRGFINFDVVERGKLRHISALHITERVAQKSLSQNALVPATVPTLITSNSANIKGRGKDYAVLLMKRHLAEHYRKYGRDGYIMQTDFRNYFARIAHQPLKDQFSRRIDDPRLIELLNGIIDHQGDVGLGLGCEPNQIGAVAFPNPIDHFVTEMCGVECFGRYMDDSYAMHTSKEHLTMVLAAIEILCSDYGIELNMRKTGIVKLSHGFTFLKVKFGYTPTGGVFARPCRETITRERRKLRSFRKKLDAGEMTMDQIAQQYQSWRGGLIHLDAHRTILSMDALYKDLFG